MSDWPLSIGEFDYHPIPRSWLDHPDSFDSDHGRGARCYAVSAAAHGSKSVRIRYFHPPTTKILRGLTAAESESGGLVPLGLLNGGGWPRSVIATVKHDDVARNAEIEHFRELWDSIDESPRVMADGGTIEAEFERPAPEDDPFVCSLCGVALGSGKRIAGDEYCDPCQREHGMKPPLVRCEHCGTRVPEEQTKPDDISAEDEYYPEFIYLCRSCSDSGGESR